MSDLTRLTIAEAQAKLRKREISSHELTSACLDRIAVVEPKLNAFITVTERQALEQAEAADKRLASGDAPPLCGIPLGIKDIYATRGVKTTCASKILENFVPPFDATVIAKLRAEGAVFVGKANMDEFAMGSSTENSAFGPTRNPYDLERVAGGSSGGSAAAVAAYECLASLGTDTGGSIREPASFCGVVGVKPTYSRISRYGVVAYASSLDQVGPFSRTVRDAAIMLRSLAGLDPNDSTCSARAVPDYERALTGDIKGLRIGVPKEYFVEGMQPEVEKSVREALANLQKAGARTVDISLPHTSYAVASYYLVATAEASANLSRYDGIRFGLRVPAENNIELYEKSRAQGFGAEVKRRIMLGTFALSAGYYDAYYLKGQKVRTLIRRDFEKAFESCDVVMAPVAPTTAFKLGEKTDDPLTMYLSDIFTISVNLAGLPGMSMPCGYDNSGLPIGLQIIGAPFSEETMFRVGDAYEKIGAFKPVGTENMNLEKYEAVIGLEVHAHLSTKSKMFCGCSTAFGAQPNENVCPRCMGMPGVLPVLNRQAVELAVRAGIAAHCEIARESIFDRKSYFYPDLPKGYQISQYLTPICKGGYIEIALKSGETKRVRLTRIHLEEDAGKNIHEADGSLVDLNRSGVPLVEIVSEPDMRTAEDAGAYLRALHAMLRYAEVSDARMAEGGMRCDVNISVRERGAEKFGVKTEIKNLNSFRFVEKAVDFEIGRQIEVIESGGKVQQETHLWDPVREETRPMRSKEFANDYRYFPEPDLPPLRVPPDLVEKVKTEMPELPDAKRARYIGEFGLTAYEAGVIIDEREVADYFEATLPGLKNRKAAANWIMTEVLRVVHDSGKSIAEAVPPANEVGALLKMVEDSKVSLNAAKTAFAAMCTSGKGAAATISELGLAQVSDQGAIATACDKVIASEPDKLAEYRSGRDKLFGFFVGQVMKAMGGKANPKVINDILKKKLAG